MQVPYLWHILWHAIFENLPTNDAKSEMRLGRLKNIAKQIQYQIAQTVFQRKTPSIDLNRWCFQFCVDYSAASAALSTNSTNAKGALSPLRKPYFSTRT